MIMLIIMVIGTITILVSVLNSSALQIARDKTTADALAQAKEALIGYAVKVQLSNSTATNQPRPGDLPCPDNHAPGSALEGTPSTPCNSSALGRLPWKALGLPDLRDSSGERLWYAVSTNFKDSPRSGTLNSDTPGTITVFASDGTLINDGNSTGAGSTGAVAVIIAPGDVLTRQGGTLQDRSSAGNNIASNYLDIATVSAITEDNANFTELPAMNGFIQGRIKDSNGNLIVNDQLIVVTQDNIMQAVQKRVAGEVKQCLNEYASLNIGRYPWAVPLTDLTNYNDSTNQLFGRIPDHLSRTENDSGDAMNNNWGPMCTIDNNNNPATWWLNWRNMVFYGLADAYQPLSSPPAANACALAGTCLSVSPTSPTANKKFVVIVAGKMLASQALRNANQTNANFYLEGGNQNADQSGAYTFTQGAPSATFNDSVIFQ